MTFSTLRLHGSPPSVLDWTEAVSTNLQKTIFSSHFDFAHYGHWRIPYVLNAEAYKNLGSMTISCLQQGTFSMLDLFACDDKDEEDSDVVT